MPDEALGVVDVGVGASFAKDRPDRLALLDVPQRRCRGVGVDDVDGGRRETRVLERLADAFRLPDRVGKDVVARVAVDAVAGDLAVDAGASCLRVVQPLERVETATLRDDDPVPGPVERPRRLCGDVVGGEGALRLEAGKDAEGVDALAHSPADGEVNLPQAKHLGGVDEPQVARGACRPDRVGPVMPRLSDASPAGLFATVRGLW